MGPTVCIVEDDSALLASLCFVLNTDGYEAHCFAAAGELLAWEGLRVGDVDCFVIDQVLPDVLGLDLLETLRQAGHQSPAILITTNPKDAVRTRARALDAVIVEKPLLGDHLVAAVRCALAQAGQQRLKINP